MTVEKMFKLCRGKENWHKLHSSFYKHVTNFLIENNLNNCSEHSFDILKAISEEVVADIEDVWYRQSLGKLW